MDTAIYAISWITCVASVASLAMSLGRMLAWDYWDWTDGIVAGTIVATIAAATAAAVLIPFVALAR